jgi:pimeloyl-ACP methyl ester carboxylesterase
VNIYIEGLKMPGMGGAVWAFKERWDKQAKYFYQSEGEKILEYIRNLPRGTKVNLIGHSYGADTAAVVAARSDRRIDKLIMIDPVSWFGAGSWFGPSYAEVRQNVEWWHNVNASQPRASINESITIPRALAGLGGPHNERAKGLADSFIDVDRDHSSFDAMMSAEQNGISGDRAVLSPNSERILEKDALKTRASPR